MENQQELLAVAKGAQVIFCDVYLTYDDEPEKVQQHLKATRGFASAIGAKRVIVKGVYSPFEEGSDAIGMDSNTLRILSPELYGSEESNTFVY